MGAALALALGGTSAAAAKPLVVAKAAVRASHDQAKVRTVRPVVARAAGHKIA